MRIDTGQHMRMEQRMKLAPRMIQSMEILQLPAAALEERLEQELSSNPTLELREAGPDEEELQIERDQEQRDTREGERELVVEDRAEGKETGSDPGAAGTKNADDFERLSNIAEEYGEAWESNTYETSDNWPMRYRGGDGERDAKMDAMANTASRPQSLGEQLLDQWHLVECSPRLRAAGELIIEHIDEDGYLRTSLDKLAQTGSENFTLAELEAALKLVQQSLEPVGMGARDIQECLLLQIDAKIAELQNSPQKQIAGTDFTVERLLISDYLKDIEANRLPKIARSTGLTVEQINQAKLNLRLFHPHPGRMLATDTPHRITPDAVIDYDEEHDRYTARLSSDRLPSVQINTQYVRMLREGGLDRKTKEFLGNNLRSARWLLEAVEQRHSTLLRVINVVIEAQRDFFDQGPQYLKPLPMTTVADQLGIHVATVSRAVSEKYVQTPRGVFPLRMFFSGGTATESGEEMSWAAVQAKLKEIIDAEDKANPLSDDELVVKLKAAGIDIARRTVAKYRKQLNIAPARQRRQFQTQ
ncbi:MAG: RNA polymerase factor sigma-54 [Phycisphaeraceae bacterium]|nr:RNA polymerase factor sigma-54 [Phycisphaeraceae bacterium]